MHGRIAHFKTLGRVALLGWVLLLAACGSVQPTQALPPSSNGYLLTIPVLSSDTQAAVAERYGGEVIAWLEGQAILKLSSQALAALPTKGISLQNTTVDPNLRVDVPMQAAGTSAGGWNSWAGGWNSWAGGWNSWAGGWNSWAGGSTPPTPPSDNNLVWDRIRLHQAHRIARNFGAGVKVAVLDTGLDTAHPMFVGRLVPSSEWRDFVDNDNNPQEGASSGRSFGHGTAVAGIVLQVAPRASILPIRVLNAEGMGTLDAVVSGINHALTSGARVINLSLGSTQGAAALETILRTAASRGVYIVASAGNAGQSEGVTFPGRYSWASGMYPFVLGVGSVDNDYFLSTFSNYGNDLVISALGEQVASAFPGSRTARVTGTSFAAPLISGQLALAFGETTSTAERGQLLSYLTQGSFQGNVMNKNLLQRGTSKLGDGIVDIESALYAMPSFTPRVAPVARLGSSSNLAFEDGLKGWTTELPGPGSITAVSGQGRGGSRAAMISVGGFGDYSLYRTISGLKPSTNYVASVWVRGSGFTNRTAPGMWVYGFGNLELWDHRDINMWNADNIYRKLTLAFRTGPLSTSVEIGVWAEAGTVYVDDFGLVEAGY